MTNTPELIDGPELLNIKEASYLLRISQRTLYMLANTGQLAALRIGGQWRFPKQKLLQTIEVKYTEQAAKLLKCNCQQEGSPLEQHDKNCPASMRPAIAATLQKTYDEGVIDGRNELAYQRGKSDG